MSLREAHKRQIESIVRSDKAKPFGPGILHAEWDDEVVSRYPKTFEGADEDEAAEYYREVWNG